MLYTIRITILWVCLVISLLTAGQSGDILKYRKVAGGYVMVLRQSDSLFQQLEFFARKENIPAANFTGMGFVNITFGYFDQASHRYKPGDYKNVELASMHGSIAWKEGKPSVHAHGVVAGEDFKAYAGHILGATVSTGSLEIMLVVHDKKLQRKKEESIGADVLQLD